MQAADVVQGVMRRVLGLKKLINVVKTVKVSLIKGVGWVCEYNGTEVFANLLQFYCKIEKMYSCCNVAASFISSHYISLYIYFSEMITFTTILTNIRVDDVFG